MHKFGSFVVLSILTTLVRIGSAKHLLPSPEENVQNRHSTSSITPTERSEKLLEDISKGLSVSPQAQEMKELADNLFAFIRYRNDLFKDSVDRIYKIGDAHAKANTREEREELERQHKVAHDALKKVYRSILVGLGFKVPRQESRIGKLKITGQHGTYDLKYLTNSRFHIETNEPVTVPLTTPEGQNLPDYRAKLTLAVEPRRRLHSHQLTMEHTQPSGSYNKGDSLRATTNSYLEGIQKPTDYSFLENDAVKTDRVTLNSRFEGIEHPELDWEWKPIRSPGVK